ncbi:cytochrome P450 [Coniophora puteana RWD-64-598 SS2]|uniref:Cytochrome P450 n=1 Tax=Coniophora puteana (strain RWD-64-598) TaxID=741705 RepID=A0A5M3MZC1_CONPW|nr:cytochrome P450 [Coniophora puteana RWD-64-598 SS2]EIW83985.1 cytochrome P450 [Coniophora puteana RWD-64-598 SS2]
MALSTSSLVLGLSLSLLIFALVKYSLKKASLPLPPGPRQLPFIGAARQIDTLKPWVTYAQWGAKYGDIISCNLFGQRTVVLNSEKAADDLLERRSRFYSDRPAHSARSMAGWDFNFTFDGYGNDWRLTRRIFQQAFREQKVRDYQPAQLNAARRLVVNIMDAPAESVWDLLSLCTSSAILATVYGYEVDTLDDPFFNITNQALTTAMPLLIPGKARITDAFPFVKHLPTFLPGTSVVRESLLARKWAKLFSDVPFNFAIDKMQSEQAFSCVLADAIRHGRENDQNYPESNLKKAVSTAFAGGADTSTSTLQSLVIAMALNPAVQEKAHADLVAVVGMDRLPTFEDQTSLSYIDAIVRETMRWGPVVPLGVSHAVMEDDVYEGYFIPKGSTIVANAWAMSRDPRRYPDPEAFRPERFLTKEGALSDDDVRWSFGWGRRICPGRYSALNAIWAAAATMMFAYRFEKATDENGLPIDITPEWTCALVSRPKAIPVHIVRRLDKVKLAQLIEESKHE